MHQVFLDNIINCSFYRCKRDFIRLSPIWQVAILTVNIAKW